MDDILFNGKNDSLKVNQIACLENDNDKLFGEVIQLVPQRQLCWFRPLFLLISNSWAKNIDNLPRIVAEPLGQNSPSKLTSNHLLKPIIVDSTRDFSSSSHTIQEAQIVDLHSGSDLLWPVDLFRPALDTEVICFMGQLKETNHTSTDKISSSKYLKLFIHRVWQDNQDKFVTK